jgi:DNA ligase-1
MYNKQLFGLEKNGDVKVWNIRVADTFHDHPEYEIVISHGKLNGKLTFKTELVSEGKQGRSVYDQAVLQAEARTKKQVDKGYRETVEELSDLPLLPMLASDYNKVGHRIQFPCFTSVKYDGVRCLAIKHCGEVRLESRTGQPYYVPHIQESLNTMMYDGQSLDGELYLHGYELQDITSAVKREDPDKEIEKATRKQAKAAKMEMDNKVSDEVWYAAQVAADQEYIDAQRIKHIRKNMEFHIFDIPMDGSFNVRLNAMDNMFEFYKYVPNIKFTQYDVCADDAQLKRQHAQAVKDGFEGVMLRNQLGVYESGKRSADLQKYKTFVDAEFEILDIIEDKNDGSIFILQNNVNDEKFGCVMGTIPERKHRLAFKNDYIGKWLKVKFQTRYKGTLLPQFPTGVCIRDCDIDGNPLE